MDYLTYSYMIDNVALLITGTLHERDTKELLERCHPLGWFETMPVLCVATNIEELYNSVLIETPLAPYFKGSLSHQDLDELNIEIVRNTLYKNYLEDFHNFVNNDPEMSMTPTGEIMSEILEFESDRRAINITINSFGTELSKEQRRKLYPEFGKLYPEGSLMLSRAEDLEGVGLAVSGVDDYKRFFDEVGFNQSSGGGAGNMAGGTGSESKSLEDMFYQKEMELSKMVFTRQFTHAVIYAWVKLREQVCPSQGNSYQNLANHSTGNPQHHLDRRMHCAEPERADRQLHQCVLIWLAKCIVPRDQHGVWDRTRLSDTGTPFWDCGLALSFQGSKHLSPTQNKKLCPSSTVSIVLMRSKYQPALATSILWGIQYCARLLTYYWLPVVRMFLDEDLLPDMLFHRSSKVQYKFFIPSCSPGLPPTHRIPLQLCDPSERF